VNFINNVERDFFPSETSGMFDVATE